VAIWLGLTALSGYFSTRGVAFSAFNTSAWTVFAVTVAILVALELLLLFRAHWGVALGVHGALAAACLAGYLMLRYGDVNFSQVQVSWVLLTVVGLLCWEWLTRKLLRLA
jgi:hypothetical protein